ncbi:GNAT family N-acetyltransferase [Rhodobacterales bacterium HKCCSP123]|nr:GNAT family N-acetyltransferase [Rhodobacterales bacterium HKCCSP123]
MGGRLLPMFDLASAPFPESMPAPVSPDPLAPLQQSMLYARAVRRLGGQTRHLRLEGTGAWLDERRLPLLGQTALVSRGPPNLSRAAARALRAATGARHLVVNAEDRDSAVALASAGFWPLARPRQIAELPLAPSADAMAAAMTGKWRNRLRHALGRGLHVRRTPMSPDPRHWLLVAERRAARHLGYRPLPPVMIAALAAAGPEAGQLFVASGPDGPLAAMLFFRHGRMATYQIGWSSAAGRTASAGNLLMWHAMLELQAMGTEVLDLGHADPALSAGLARFKCGTGARLRSLGGTWMASGALPRRPGRRAGATPLPDARDRTVQGAPDHAGPRRSDQQPATALRSLAREGGTALISSPVKTCSVPRSRSITAWSLTQPPISR